MDRLRHRLDNLTVLLEIYYYREISKYNCC